MNTGVLIVEDEPTLLRSLARALAETAYPVLTATSAPEALDLHERHSRDLGVVWADVDLGSDSGLDVVDRIRDRDDELGVVVATGRDTPEVARRAVDLSVQGYLLKPFQMNEAVINVANAFRWRKLAVENRFHRSNLEDLVARRTEELRTSRWETIHRLARAAEHRDPETGHHLTRMSEYSSILARRAGLTPSQCEDIRLASPMHDVGKIGIPDDLLTYPGRYDDAMRAEMARHTVIGHQILSGSESPLLDMAADIALGHHERWDGGGYPHGRVGAETPLAARIVAVADVFDALTSKRRYKDAFSIDETVNTMQAGRGTHFDPELLDLFLADLDDCLLVREAWSD